jgi:ribosomal protein L37AE/L43A
MGWYEAIKDLVTVADRLRDADLKHRLADVQLEYAKLAEENVRLRQELLDLREHAQTRQEMHYQDNVYWRRSGQDKVEGPFCPKCLDGQDKPARMSERSGDSFWRCPVCNTAIRKPGAEPVRLSEPSYDPFPR